MSPLTLVSMLHLTAVILPGKWKVDPNAHGLQWGLLTGYDTVW